MIAWLPTTRASCANCHCPIYYRRPHREVFLGVCDTSPVSDVTGCTALVEDDNPQGRKA